MASRFGSIDHLKGVGTQCYDLDMLLCSARLHWTGTLGFRFGGVVVVYCSGCFSG